MGIVGMRCRHGLGMSSPVLLMIAVACGHLVACDEIYDREFPTSFGFHPGWCNNIETMLAMPAVTDHPDR